MGLALMMMMMIIIISTSVGVAAAFQLCFTARHFRDRRRSGPIVTPALILTFYLLSLRNYTPKGIKNNNNDNITYSFNSQIDRLQLHYTESKKRNIELNTITR